MKKFAGLFLFFSVFLSSFQAVSNPFNSKLSGQELENLKNGQVLIRNIDSIKDICMEENIHTTKIISTMKKLDPSYIAEIIQIRPYKGNENLEEVINNALLNIQDYVGIPYYSERNKKWYKLYSSAAITSLKETENTTDIDCQLEMEPFGVFNSKVQIEKTPDYFYYQLKNLDKLVYKKKFTAVKPQKMYSCINLYRDGENWILYGIGGVDALRVFFLEDRIELSFINRIKTFCNFIFTKL